MKQLFKSIILLLMTILLLVFSVYAWFLTNTNAEAKSISGYTETTDVSATLTYYNARLNSNNSVVIDTRINNFKMPTYKMLPSINDNNCIVAKLDITPNIINPIISFKSYCTTTNYSTEYPVEENKENNILEVNNYISNIIRIGSLEVTTVNNESSYKLTSSKSFVDMSSIIPEKEVTLNLLNNIVLNEEKTYTYYFVIYYYDLSIAYFYSQNIDKANLSGSGSLLFTNDISFQIS